MIVSHSMEHRDTWVIIQITDTHLMGQAEKEFVQMNPEQSFHAVIQQILLQHPHIDAIIHTGDLAQEPEHITYQRYLSYMQGLGIPFFQVPGNHDDLDYFPFQQSYHEPGIVELGNWCLFLLNSAVDGRVDGYISQTQLKALEQQLQQHAHQHVLIACHHHPFEMRSRWIDQHKLKNTSELTEILAQHSNIQAVICGHVHQDSIHIWNNIQFLSTPSTSVQFKPLSDQFALDEQAPGYRILKLHSSGQLDTQVHRLKDFHHRIETEISGY